MDITPEFLKAAVDPVAELVRLSLEEGHSRVLDVRALLEIDSNPWFDSNVIRTVARQRIEAAATAGTSDVWGIDTRASNSGIHLAVPAGRIKVLQGGMQRVPSPGHNKARRAFYTQRQSTVQPMLPGFATDEGESHDPINMLLLWNARGEDHIELAVAVPYGIWHHGKRARLLAFVPLDDDLDAISGEFAADEDDGAWLVHDIHAGEIGEDIGS